MRDDGTDADINELGELWLRGGNVALGYWNNEKASKETFVDGWVHTGNKFYVDADGHFWFVLFTSYVNGSFIHHLVFVLLLGTLIERRWFFSAVISKNQANNSCHSGYSQSFRYPGIPCRN